MEGVKRLRNRENTVSGQLVDYLDRSAPPAFIRSLSYCHQKAKGFSIASRA